MLRAGNVGSNTAADHIEATRLAYSAGFAITEDVQHAILAVPARAWTPPMTPDGLVRPVGGPATLTGHQ